MDGIKPRILCVDDEPNVLSGLSRQLRRDFQVTIAESGEEGLSILREEPEFAVITSDFMMPGMNGVDFLRKARMLSADTTRILLTGHADFNIAIEAVNEGAIYRFLLKPCPPETLQKTIGEAVRQYELVQAEKILLERTLSGSIQVLVNVLSLASPQAFSRASRIRQTVKLLIEQTSIPDPWQYEMAAGLSQIGCVAIRQDLMEKVSSGRLLSTTEQQEFQQHPKMASQLLTSIPRLEQISEMIRRQAEPCEKEQQTCKLRELDPATLGAQLLYLANAYEELLDRGRTHQQAVNELRKRLDEFHPALMLALDITPQEQATVTEWSCKVSELRTGMMINADVRARNGTLLINRGQGVDAMVLERLRQVARQIGVLEPIQVLIPNNA